MIIVNGQNQEISLPMDLVTYLQENNYPLDKIAIELNGQIVPKAKYAQTILCGLDYIFDLYFSTLCTIKNKR